MDFYQQALEHPWKERVLKITFSPKNTERSEGSLACEVELLAFMQPMGPPSSGTYSGREEGGTHRDRCVLAAGGKLGTQPSQSDRLAQTVPEGVAR